MKHTVFQFTLRLAEEGKNELLAAVVAKLRGVENVDEVQSEHTESGAALRVRCSFPDGETAKKLHRMIMSTLMRMDGVVITGVTSNLTDVFG
jgi:hypothetical protein